jgi:hypothetical protein
LLGGARPWPVGGTEEAEGTWRRESTADACIGVARVDLCWVGLTGSS